MYASLSVRAIFFKEHFLLHRLSVSVPQESSSVFVTNNTRDILFSLETCGYLHTANQIIGIADQSNVAYDTFHLSDLLAAQTSDEFWRMVTVSQIYHQ